MVSGDFDGLRFDLFSVYLDLKFGILGILGCLVVYLNFVSLCWNLGVWGWYKTSFVVLGSLSFFVWWLEFS